MKNVAFIPVRGGSKSIPLKNIKLFCGKPLVYWTALAAQNSEDIDEIVIATDDDGIKEIVKSFNFSKLTVFNRSSENANDTASTESVMLEFIQKSDLNGEDGFVLIQATSPFLQSSDISQGFKKLHELKGDTLLSCSEVKRFFWGQDGVPQNYDFKNRPRRQDFDGSLIENGAFYISSVDQILKSKNRLSGKIVVYSMPEFTMTEIDEPDDWVYSEYLMKKYILKVVRPQKIKLVLSDVDGVLTDAGMYYSENGDELKKFNTHDGMGFQILRETGIMTGIITSENTEIVTKRAKKLKVDYLFQGKQHGGKLEAANVICKELGITLNEVAYIGDDVNCFDLLSNVGFAACPSDAVYKVRNIPGIQILSTKGGEGVFREFTEEIIK